MGLIIIGVCGRKRHGKDTVGGFLRDEANFTPIAFADPIKRIAMDLYSFSYDQCYGTREDKETVDPRYGFSPRHAMQQIGTEMFRNLYEPTWVEYAKTTINRARAGQNPPIHSPQAKAFLPTSLVARDTSRWVITDVRFPDEARAIREMGGQVWKVVRPSLLEGLNDTHASETSVDWIEPDLLITTDSTLEDLRSKVIGALALPEL
jgi:hypothetical protein